MAWGVVGVESLVVVPREENLGLNRFTRSTAIVISGISETSGDLRFVRTGAMRISFGRLTGRYVAPIFTGSGRLAVGRTRFVSIVTSTTRSFFGNRAMSTPGVQISRMVGKQAPRTVRGETGRLLRDRGAVCCREYTFDVSIPAVCRAMRKGGLGLSVIKIETCGRVGLCSGGDPRLFELTVNFGGRIYYGVYIFASKCGSSLGISGISRLCGNTLRLFRGFGPTGRVRLLRALKGAAVDRRRFYRVLKEVELCRYLPAGVRGQLPEVLLASARVGSITGSCVGSRGFYNANNRLGV